MRGIFVVGAGAAAGIGPARRDALRDVEGFEPVDAGRGTRQVFPRGGNAGGKAGGNGAAPPDKIGDVRC